MTMHGLINQCNSTTQTTSYNFIIFDNNLQLDIMDNFFINSYKNQSQEIAYQIKATRKVSHV